MQSEENDPKPPHAAKSTVGSPAVHRFRLRKSLSRVCSAFPVDEEKKVEFSSHTGNLALMRKFVRAFLECIRSPKRSAR